MKEPLKNNLIGLWGMVIVFGWIPLGLLGLRLGKHLSLEQQLVYFVVWTVGFVIGIALWAIGREKKHG